MPRRLQPTLTDYVVVAINPALIMVLIGSLVYFLLELFYQGHYPDRLHYCLSWFIFGIVLISRISMEEGWERAAPLGVALVVVVALALNKFVRYENADVAQFGWIINYSLMALIWWCAHQLTWDCTLIDESQDASGEGLLQTVGLDSKQEARGDRAPTTAPRDEAQESEPLADDLLGRAVAPTKRSDQKSWWDQFIERRRRPHAPGVWVVYFSLAALPLFGLGQAFIPAANEESRRYAFLLLCIYVACGLALLLTTSFLGLRRYLRQRRLEMPPAMAGTWLTIGAVLITTLIFFTALLPRPNAEFDISRLPWQADSQNQDSSKLAVGNEGTQDDQAKSGSAASHDKNQQSRSDEKDSREGGGSSDAQRKGNATKPSEKGKAASKSDSDGQSKGGGSKSDDRSKSDQSSKGDSAKTDSRNNSKPESGKKSESQQKAVQPPQEQSQPQPQQNPAPPPMPAPSMSLEWLISLVKWLFYGSLVLLGVWWAWRHIDDIANWLASLLAGWRSVFAGQKEKPAAPEAQIRLKSFAEYADPFATGLADRYSPEELVRYSFEALEAWGRDNGIPRDPDQTVHEFSRAVAAIADYLAGSARQLADLYSRAAYAPGTLPPNTVDQLRDFWQTIDARQLVA